MQIFDAQHIGQQIATARKAKNMTQSALADQLGVSYQAVSNWERSQSLPDIDKYAQLAEALDLDLATLIGSQEGAHTVVVINDDDAAVDSTTLTAAAPVMKPQAVDAKAAKVDLPMDKLKMVAPFLSEATLVEHLEAQKHEPGFNEALVELAPFIGQANIEPLVADLDVTKEADQALLFKLAPFRTYDANDETAKAILAQTHSLKAVKKLFPFLSKPTLDDLFTQAAQADSLDKGLTAMAPFVSETAVAAHVKALLQNGDSQAARAFMPFLSDAGLLGLMN
ncbi:helix-turn-helix domain-containing protein [Lacticaseibacillus salsurivasis]|uniref:helix-turn-helix domain-containing protein n=1 Tax=Lacticaseibacillus salsurivasis TaxID=3081441 RepID=UPI0030C6B1F9